MTTRDTATRSLRAMRLQAGVVRAFGVLVIVVLCAAGIHSILAPTPAPVVSRPAAIQTADQGAEAFADTFTRAYLTWSAADAGQHESALKPFLSTSLDSNAGVEPGKGTESVQWTDVVGERRLGQQTLVTVAAQTNNGLIYLSVPVSRDAHGFLFVSSYPAFVGPPASDGNASLPPEPEVTDTSLQTVAARAVTNFLAGNQGNLLADLTPQALVSLPSKHLTVTSTQPATWIVPNHRVAIEVTASDTRGSSWTFTYDLDVQKLDRWYVSSIQVDPTFQGGGS